MLRNWIRNQLKEIIRTLGEDIGPQQKITIEGKTITYKQPNPILFLIYSPILIICYNLLKII